MTEDETHSTEVVGGGSGEPEINVEGLLKTVISEKNSMELVNFLKNYTYDIATTEIPTDQSKIEQLNKEELRAIVQKLNLFSTFNINAANPDQLEALREQALNCWGSPPKSDGTWVEWCLWHHYQRQTGELNSIKGDEAQSLREQASKYVEKRERLRKEQLVESGQYNDVEEIPNSIRDTIAGIFQPNPQQDASGLPEEEQ